MKISGITNYYLPKTDTKKNTSLQIQNNDVQSNAVFEYLSAIGNYNITFGDTKIAIYKIEKDGTYEKFSGVNDAARKLNIDASKISNSLKGGNPRTLDCTFMKASEIEISSQDGKTILDKEKIDAKFKELEEKTPNKNKRKAIYQVFKNGSYRKFDSLVTAGKELGMTESKISNCLKGANAKTLDFTFMLASDIETINEDGDIIIDENVVATRLKELEEKDPYRSKKKSIYRIDKNGNYKRYNSLSEASQELGIEDSNISDCLYGKQKSSGGYTFVLASDVERIDNNGNLKIQKKKIKKIAEELKNHLSSHFILKPFYAVDKDGNYTRFESHTEACHALNLDNPDIRKCLEGNRFTTNGYAFIYTDRVEETDENGNTIVKINFPQEIFEHRNPIQIYSINSKAEVKKFPSINDAANYYEISKRHIHSCLDGKKETTAGMAFIRADEFEIKTADKKKGLNEEKFNKLFQQIIKNAVYVVDRNGNYKRYNSNAEAAKDYDVTPEQIKGCSMNHIKGLKSGHSVVKARLVESIKDGKIVINKEIIDEYAKKAEQVRDRAIWAKDAEGKKRKFKSVENASTELGIPVKAINRCLSGKSQTTRDYHFEYVKESPSIPIERKKRDKTIFAMDCEGNIKTFADIDTAARVLDVEKEDIQQLLKIGSLKGKRTSLKGYVFSTANDE